MAMAKTKPSCWVSWLSMSSVEFFPLFENSAARIQYLNSSCKRERFGWNEVISYLTGCWVHVGQIGKVRQGPSFSCSALDVALLKLWVLLCKFTK